MNEHYDFKQPSWCELKWASLCDLLPVDQGSVGTAELSDKSVSNPL